MLSRDVRLTRALSVVSFLASLVLSMALAHSRAGMVPVAVFALACLGLWHGTPRIRHTAILNAVVALAVLNGLIVVPELLLRLRDFRYEAGIQFGYPRPTGFAYLEPDEKLFWRRNRDDKNVNSLGFVGREVQIPKPAGCFRILFFGDSVTEQGFPDVVGHLLNLDGPDTLRFDCVSLAAAGYSSYQGTVLADLYGSALEPDAAVVLFGWNDHYQAYGAPDRRKTVSPAPASRGAGRWLGTLRLAQLAAWAADGLRGSRPHPLNELRVSPEEYRGNLGYIHDRLTGGGVPVLFLTAPTSHYRWDTPDYLVRKGFASGKQRSQALHRQYNEIVREVARERGALLVDLERELAHLPPRDVAALFSRDGIHLSLAGSAVVASRIAKALHPLIREP
ncbi:hypothetical protein JXA88_10015 [Candidatus Fermentibacteria bacterium]|nr:hypothetical protein [Candidatus Fermentibacteria bacterium]